MAKANERGIKQVIHATGMGPRPACCNRKTGTVYVNAEMWPTLPYEWKVFILLHEEGHIVLDTSNEREVDAYAFYKYAERGHSLTQSIFALTRMLSFRSPEHFDRLEAQRERARAYDFYVKNNNKIDLNE